MRFVYNISFTYQPIFSSIAFLFHSFCCTILCSCLCFFKVSIVVYSAVCTFQINFTKNQKKKALVTKISFIFSTNQFLAVQGPFLHQLSPFLVCRLVITLFCGRFNDFGKNLIFWVKNSKIRHRKYAFLVQISFKQQIQVDPI